MTLSEEALDQDLAEAEAEVCTQLLMILYLAVHRGEDMIRRHHLAPDMILSGQDLERLSGEDAGLPEDVAPAGAEDLVGLGLAVTSSKRAVKLRVAVGLT